MTSFAVAPPFDQFEVPPESFPPRDGYGRPMIVPPGGGKPVPYTRASTFARTLSDAGGLVDWKARLVALGVGRYEDLAAMAAGLEYGDPLLDEIVQTAHDRAGGNVKANYGTAVHKFTDPDCPTEHIPLRMRDDVASYWAELKRRGATVVAYNRFIVNDRYQVAGTFDAILNFPTWGNVMEDRKTGNLHALDVAIQLAIYSTGQYYEENPDGGDPIRTPLPALHQPFGIATHIPKGEGRCVMHKVDLVAGREACDLAVDVRRWRKRLDVMVPLEYADDKAPEPVADDKPKLTDRQMLEASIKLAIKFAPTTQRLEQTYWNNADVWTQEMTDLARQRRAHLELRTGGADEGGKDE